MIGSLTKEALAMSMAPDAAAFNGSAEYAGLDAAFDAFVRSPRAAGPDWAREVRLTAFARFTELGFPTRKDEEWKYTSLRGITEQPWTLEPDGTASDAAERELAGRLGDKIHAGELTLVFIDGVLSTAKSRIGALPNGLKITPLGEALTTRANVLKDRLSAALATPSAFECLNLAFLESGLLIEVERNAAVEPVIHILHVITAGNVVRAPRHIVLLAEGAEASLVETFWTLGAVRSLTVGITDVDLAPNAKLSHAKVQLDGAAGVSVSSIRANVGRSARYQSFSFATAGRMTRGDFDVVLAGEGAEASLDGLYIGRDKGHVDHHTQVDHKVPNTTSAQLYKGVMRDASRAVFNGKVFVRLGAQKTSAAQLNRNLLLSSDAEVDTKPQLEIDADDVKCSHGASVGPLDQDEIFYLKSRAIPEAEAIQMLSLGFADEVIFRLPVAAHRDDLRRHVREALTHA